MENEPRVERTGPSSSWPRSGDVYGFAALLAVGIGLDFNVYVIHLAHLYVHDVTAALIGLLGVRLALRNRRLVAGGRWALAPLGVLLFVLASTALVGAMNYPGVPPDMRKLFWLEHGDAVRIAGELLAIIWTFGQLNVDRGEAWFVVDVAAWAACVPVVLTVGVAIATNAPHSTTTSFDADVLAGTPIAVALLARRWPPRRLDMLRVVVFGMGSSLLFSRATMLVIAFVTLAVIAAARRWRTAALVVGGIAAGWMVVVLASLALYGSASLIATTVLRLESLGDTRLAPYTIPNRVAIWRDALHMARRSPLIGVGYHDYFLYSSVTEIKSASPPEPNDLFSSRIKSAHNDYLSWLSEMGVVGLLVLVGFWATALVRAADRWRREPRERVLNTYTVALILAFLGISLFGEVLIPRTPDAVPVAAIWWIVLVQLFLASSRQAPAAESDRRA